MWLCKSIEKREEEKSESKRRTSVPTSKTMGTSMPASHSEKEEKERIKIAHVFLRKALRRE